MDYFLPLFLFLFVCAVITLLWWSSAFDLVGGWAGALTFLAVFFGVRFDYLRRQKEKIRAQHEETVAWVENEIRTVYNGISDSSGELYVNCCKLFELTATLTADDDLTVFKQKLERLRAGRRTSGLRMPDLIKKLDIDMTYNSNAIEGNPITLRETALILAGFVAGRRKSIRHVNDIVGHSAAFHQVQKMAASGSQVSMSMEQVLRVHALVLLNSDDGGVFRSEGEVAMVGGTKVLLSMPDEIEALVKRLLDWTSLKRNQNMHPLLLAVNFHYIFVRIHPFRDGNGRTARLLSNLILMEHGYPPIIVPVRKKEQYMTSLREWNAGDSEPFASFMVELLNESFNHYFSVLKI